MKLIVLGSKEDFDSLWDAAAPKNRRIWGCSAGDHLAAVRRDDIFYVWAGDCQVSYVEELEKAVPC